MKIRFCKSFLSRILRRRQPISTVYPTPTMSFLSPPLTTTTTSTIGANTTTRGMLRSRSEDNIKKLGDCMDNMDEDVSKLFVEFQQTDLREDPELFRLLNKYFSTSKSVSHLCESLKTCLERAEKKDYNLIDEALSNFHEEQLSYRGLMEASFRKTFSDLRNFNDFDDHNLDYCEFLSKLQSCHEELAKMIVELEKTMKRIDKKLRRVRGRRAIGAIVTAALLAPVIVAIFISKTVAGGFGLVPLEALSSFVASRWKRSTEALKLQKTAMSSMERGTTVALKEVEKITKLVSRLESVEKSIRVATEFAVKKRDSMAVAMREVEEERKSLKLTFLELDRETGQCDGFAQFGRTVALEKMTEFLSRGQKSSTK
ncbi:PREDICTED: UPF0496 protein At3g57100-like [Camelina sativa]|uniref:UPF0496 protein At3g57100-like n=1 Tax=Camelina sativa TaxID=90675 RepID=A0ABM0T1E6_CAMSA|nr:PREDICTED: UPF0496 protein At3g57100-like [Camelina sativa]